MLSSLTGLNFSLISGSLPPTTFSVVSFELIESFSSPFALHVRMVSSDPAVDFAAVMDNTATLTVTDTGVLQRTVSGVVSSFEQGDTGLHQTEYQMVIRPALWRASLRLNSRIFQLQDIQSILDVIVDENRIMDVEYAFRFPHPQREFCVQYGETDLEFIQRLTAEEGIFYFFEFSGKKHTLVFADDMSALGKGLVLPYNATDAAASPENCISSFRRGSQVRPAKVTMKDYTFKNPAWGALYEQFGKDLQNQQETYEHYDYPGRYKDESGNNFSKYRLDGLRNGAQQGHGQSNAFTLQPGILFTLTSHPRADFNTRWQPVSTIHSGSQPRALLTSSAGQGTTLSCQFSFIPAKQTWRPYPLAKPVVDGPQIAKVVGPAGEEIYTDAHGRVRLQFPWDREATGDDRSSCWVRVSQAWAGQGWGAIAIPRVGQEVIVDFLGGDPDQPIVTGRTYHASNIVPNKLPGKKTQMSIKSKSYKSNGFNELRFDDATGAEELYLHAQKDMNTKVLHDRTTDVNNDHTETVKGNQSVTVNKNQTTTVNQNQTNTIDQNQTTTVKQNKVETVLLTSTEMVGLAKTSTVGAAYALTVGAAMNTAVALSQTEQVGISKSVNVGKSLSLDAGDSITLTCGATSFKMEKGGKVTIQGTEFLFEASGPVRINGKDVDIN